MGGARVADGRRSRFPQIGKTPRGFPRGVAFSVSSSRVLLREIASYKRKKRKGFSPRRILISKLDGVLRGVYNEKVKDAAYAEALTNWQIVLGRAAKAPSLQIRTFSERYERSDQRKRT